MKKKQSSAKRRKYFLLDSNQTVRKKPKTTRNRALNAMAKLRFFRQFGSLLKGSTLLTLACIFMLAFTLFAFFSPYFDLKQVEVKRDNPALDVQAVENLMAEFYGQNLLFISQSNIEQRLLETFPEFREVKLSENWPDTLVVEIVLSPPFYQVLNEYDATFSVLSEDGVVLRQEAAEGLPVLKILNYDQTLKSREKFATPQVLKDITALRTMFAEELRIPVEEIRYLPIAYEVHLVSDSGTAFWFDLRADTLQQARKIDLVSDEINLYTQPLEHVDLRIPNQVFWKPL
ncbi:FtsQ-type POTRA domain-containing protein [bacterium]|nr:FtsQ-type POTRA domain-containing protein [bacterium]NCQ54794.1 FtsQ-type POTRA domain-containing protein [Candidatus Parcubacteria bacterium]NCS66838.1 FtsQ-type POTRA domain-containing protein [Candidatus Peregrinibacteria bacterium]NCS95784.1 FtsQ-type POTRA domain-containing protein [bacterium]